MTGGGALRSWVTRAGTNVYMLSEDYTHLFSSWNAVHERPITDCYTEVLFEAAMVRMCVSNNG